MRHKHLSLRTDFGSVRMTRELREAVSLICGAADILQMTPAETIECMLDVPDHCPKCRKEEKQSRV